MTKPQDFHPGAYFVGKSNSEIPEEGFELVPLIFAQLLIDLDHGSRIPAVPEDGFRDRFRATVVQEEEAVLRSFFVRVGPENLDIT